MSTPKDKAQAILAAAQRVFFLHGFSRTRIEDIAQEAGVGKGTVYEYFSSKKDVFEQAIEDGMTQYMDDLNKLICNDCSPIEKLNRVSKMHFQFMTKNRDFARLLVSDPVAMSPHRHRLIEISREAQQMVAGVIQEGIDAGSLRPVDALFATRAFFGVLSAIGGAYLIDQRPSLPEKVAADLMDLVIGGLATTKETGSN